MPNATESRIKDRIAEFVQELDLLLRRNTLDALKGALEGRAAPARRGRPPGSGRGPGRPAPTSSADVLAAKITAQVRSSPGQTVGEIVSGVGAKPAVVKKTIKAMLDAGEIRKAGQKRGTQYFPPGPGRLPGAVVKRAKKRGAKRTTRKLKRRASPKKKARKAASRKKPTASRKLIVPAPKRRATPPKEGTKVPHHLEVSPRPALAVAE